MGVALTKDKVFSAVFMELLQQFLLQTSSFIYYNPLVLRYDQPLFDNDVEFHQTGQVISIPLKVPA